MSVVDPLDRICVDLKNHGIVSPATHKEKFDRYRIGAFAITQFLKQTDVNSIRNIGLMDADLRSISWARTRNSNVPISEFKANKHVCIDQNRSENKRGWLDHILLTVVYDDMLTITTKLEPDQAVHMEALTYQHPELLPHIESWSNLISSQDRLSWLKDQRSALDSQIVYVKRVSKLIESQNFVIRACTEMKKRVNLDLSGEAPGERRIHLANLRSRLNSLIESAGFDELEGVVSPVELDDKFIMRFEAVKKQVDEHVQYR